jgi:putative effector of murein hydrolase
MLFLGIRDAVDYTMHVHCKYVLLTSLCPCFRRVPSQISLPRSSVSTMTDTDVTTFTFTVLLILCIRSVTTPLAMVVANMLEADANSTVCFVILTGILGTILGPYLLKLLRVKEDDYVTIGVAMGSASHAISTASLLRTNPRAAAIASLSFVIFGTIFVILVSIPVIPQTMRQLVGF